MILTICADNEDHVIQWRPYFQRDDEGFQIDLIYLRDDRVITLCEIKYYEKEVPITVVHEVKRKFIDLLLSKF